MSSAHWLLSCVALVAVSGCSPANYIKRARPAEPCEVAVCINQGASPARCSCQARIEVIRQMKTVMGDKS